MTVCICVKGDEFGPDLLTDQCEVHRPKAPLFYTGIGARQTPPAMLATITAIASRLATLGWTCRTGGADGADTAFEVGAAIGGREAALYLPWPGFNGRRNAKLARPTTRALLLAAHHHPSWRALTPGARGLHARNVHQVFGADLQIPSQFVLCWTPDGAETTTTRATGGTGQAIRIAIAYSVPAVNMAREGWRERISAMERGR